MVPPWLSVLSQRAVCPELFLALTHLQSLFLALFLKCCQHLAQLVLKGIGVQRRPIWALLGTGERGQSLLLPSPVTT